MPNLLYIIFQFILLLIMVYGIFYLVKKATKGDETPDMYNWNDKKKDN